MVVVTITSITKHYGNKYFTACCWKRCILIVYPAGEVVSAVTQSSGIATRTCHVAMSWLRHSVWYSGFHDSHQFSGPHRRPLLWQVVLGLHGRLFWCDMVTGLLRCGWIFQGGCHQREIQVVHIGHDKHFLVRGKRKPRRQFIPWRFRSYWLTGEAVQTDWPGTHTAAFSRSTRSHGWRWLPAPRA